MQTKDHYRLTKLLSQHIGLKRSKRAAFILGNILPDINCLTYITNKGKHKLNGHSFKSRINYMQNIWKKRNKNSAGAWFRFGEMLHYVTDSFTRPHNEEFTYSSKAHAAYELTLHKLFEHHIKHGHTRRIIDRAKDEPILEFGSWIKEKHAKYLRESKGIEQDLLYIIHTVASVCSGLVRKEHAKGKKAGGVRPKAPLCKDRAAVTAK